MLAPDLEHALLLADIGQVFERDHPSLGIGDLELADRLDVVTRLGIEADLDREPALAFDDLADDLASQRRDHVEDVGGVDPVPGDPLAIDDDPQERQSAQDLCLHVRAVQGYDGEQPPGRRLSPGARPGRRRRGPARRRT